jgi:hypothetical protein
MLQPKRYELKNGKKVEVHTPFTTRAKELMQLYNGLNLPLLTIDERLDVLLHVKWTVKVQQLVPCVHPVLCVCIADSRSPVLAQEFDCNLTREIVEVSGRLRDSALVAHGLSTHRSCSTHPHSLCCLYSPLTLLLSLTPLSLTLLQLIDREADLLNRGRRPNMLEGLRKRIASLFLTFLETPEFNPEAAAYQVRAVHSQGPQVLAALRALRWPRSLGPWRFSACV